MPTNLTDEIIATAWQVPSEEHPGIVYTVTRTPSGEMTCTCPHYRYRRPGDPHIDDKHVERVRAYLALQRAGLGGLLHQLTPADVTALAAASDAIARLAAGSMR